MADIIEHSDQNTGESTAERFCMSMPLPPFHPDFPGLWFIQVEACFNLANIKSDQTKFNLVFCSLEEKYACEVKDIILNPPATGKYEKLKSELIKRLIIYEKIGDRTPYQLYRHLRNFVGSGVSDEFLKSAWMSRLPANIRDIISCLSNPDLDELAKLADLLHEFLGRKVASTAAAASSSAPSNSLSSEIDALTKKVEKLELQVERLSRPRGRSRSRTRHPSIRNRSTSRSQSSYRRYPQCWYHHSFGDQARKCVKPCDYETSRNVRGNR